jgi:hypothetical protein
MKENWNQKTQNQKKRKQTPRHVASYQQHLCYDSHALHMHLCSQMIYPYSYDNKMSVYTISSMNSMQNESKHGPTTLLVY